MGDPTLYEVAFGVMNSAANQTTHVKSGSNNDGDISFDPWILLKGLLPLCTIAIGVAGYFLLEHAIMVMTTLAEVETPIPGGVDSEKLGSHEYGILEHKDVKDKEAAAVPVQPKPRYVTSSIRATLRHLNAEAGDLSIFRAIGAKSAIVLLMMPLALVLDIPLQRIIKNSRLNELATDIACWLIVAQSWATLTHIIISKPRHKFWFRRLPLSWFGVLRRVFVATVASSLADAAISWAFRYFDSKPDQKEPAPKTPSGRTLGQGPPVSINLAFLVWMVAKVMLRSQIKPLIRMALTKPLHALHTRIYASMLPDTDDPIVPMDRSFQGRPQSGGILQQTAQPLSFRQAALTVDKPTYLRLLKLDIKLHIIKQGAEWAFWALVFFQVVCFIGFDSIWFLLKLLSGTPLVQQDLDAVQSNATRKLFNGFIAQPSNVTVPAINSTLAL